ncbi:hypothetical protein [Lentzea sp. NPDC055074]
MPPRRSATSDAGAAAWVDPPNGYPEWNNNIGYFQVNSRPAHATFMPCADLQQVLTGERTNSPFRLDLTATWRFKHVTRAADRDQNLWRTDYDDSGWAALPVPSSWQLHGYDNPIYVEAGTPVAQRPPRSASVVVLPRGDAHPVIDLILPDRARNSPLFPPAEVLADVWWDLGHQLVRGTPPIQIGGVPWMEQDDTFEIAAEEAGNQPEDWALLGSWTPEGDGEHHGYLIGSLQMLVRREDVTARRFDRLSLFWQQQG